MPKAEHAFATAARLGRDDPSVINSYAGFLCRTNQPAQGEKLFVKVARNPLYQTPEVALVNAGVCVRNSGDNISAERYFRDALAIRPNYAEALLQLGGLLLDRDEAPEALLMVQRYVAVNPPSPEILWLGLRVERKLGDDSAAGEFARRLQSEFPGSEQARMLQSGLAR